MNQIKIPLAAIVITLHEVLLFAFPITVSFLSAISQLVQNQSGAMILLAGRGPWSTAISVIDSVCFIAAVILVIIRIWICIKSFSSLYRRTLLYKYFLFVCVFLSIIICNALLAETLGTLSRSSSSTQVLNSKDLATVVKGEEHGNQRIALRDGSVIVSPSHLLQPACALVMYGLICGYFRRTSRIEANLKITAL